MTGWRPALRIAVRSARRSPGRSLLVALLVGVPVAGATTADLLYRTIGDNPAARTEQILGAADAVIAVTPYERLPNYQPTSYGGHYGSVRDVERRPNREVDLAALLPSGSRLVKIPGRQSIRLVTDMGAIDAALATYADDPMTSGHLDMLAGSAPSGDSVVVTVPLAERLSLLDDDGDLVAGATVALPHGPRAEVVGLAVDPGCLSCDLVGARPDAALAVAADERAPRGGWYPYGSGEVDPGSWLVDLADEVDAFTVVQPLAKHGVAVTPREVFLHPEDYGLSRPGSGVSTESLRAAALVALIVGLGLLEVVLLAGAAFAVGAKRQVRDLGLVQAQGGTSRHVRRIVLAQGLLLGVVGAVLGLLGGAAVALAGTPLWELAANANIPGWRAGWPELALAGTVGVLSGLAAAVVPAIGASRLTPVAALAARFRSAQASTRAPAMGLVFLAAGLLTGAIGSVLLAGDFATYQRRLSQVAEGRYVPPPDASLPVALILGGFALVAVGLVLAVPALVAVTARLGRVLPVSPRLAFRDAARHRHRTGPATTAITVAVAASVVAAFVVLGAENKARMDWSPALPLGSALVQPGTQLSAANDQWLGDVSEAATRAVPDTTVTPIDSALRPSSGGAPSLERRAKRPSEREVLYASVRLGSPRCPGCIAMQTEVAVGDAALVEVLTDGAGSDAAAEALAAGSAVTFHSGAVDEAGTVRLPAGKPGNPVEVPAVVVERPLDYHSLPGVVLPAPLAHELGLATRTTGALLVPDHELTQVERDQLTAAAGASGANIEFEKGFDRTYALTLLGLAVGSALVTLLGVAISVALSAAEGRADLATLAAIGAPPHRRRSLAAAQALLIGGLGCLLGLGLGAATGWAIWPTTGAPEYAVPWGNLALTGLAVPTLAVVVAALFTPSRLPLVRRAE